MRQIGSLERESDARRFTSYLVTAGIAATYDQETQDKWVIWVREENELQRAKKELDHFLASPGDPQFSPAVEKQADQIQRQRRQEAERAARQQINMRGRWNAPISRQAPLVMTLIGICVVVGLLTSFGSARTGRVMRTLMFCDPLVYQLTSDGLASVKQGQLWRAVTPVFLHGSLMHLAFNMYWLYLFGTQIEARRGTPRFAGLVLLTAIGSNLAQYFLGGVSLQGGAFLMHPSPYFLGMSGVDYGLLGYIWMRRRIDPRCGLLLSDSTLFILLFFLVLGFTGAMDGLVGGSIANWAHAGGLAVGALIGYWPALRSGPHR